MIILDTHAWIWLVSEPEKLSKKAIEAIDYAIKIGVCPISCWEISTKVANGKLQLDRSIDIWVEQALARPRVKLMELTAEIAIMAGRIGKEGFHGDPADRIIVSTAIVHGAGLITKDRKIISFPKVQTIW